jgi:hypothetical protein
MCMYTCAYMSMICVCVCVCVCVCTRALGLLHFPGVEGSLLLLIADFQPYFLLLPFGRDSDSGGPNFLGLPFGNYLPSDSTSSCLILNHAEIL